MTAEKNLQDMHTGTINVCLSIPLLTNVPLTKTVDFIFKEENDSSVGQRTNLAVDERIFSSLGQRNVTGTKSYLSQA